MRMRHQLFFDIQAVEFAIYTVALFLIVVFFYVILYHARRKRLRNVLPWLVPAIVAVTFRGRPASSATRSYMVSRRDSRHSHSSAFWLFSPLLHQCWPYSSSSGSFSGGLNGLGRHYEAKAQPLSNKSRLWNEGKHGRRLLMFRKYSTVS